MLLARGFSYSDAHRARLGVNYKQIPVNTPRVPVHKLQQGRRDAGRARLRPGVYAPNSKGGPAADSEHYQPVGWYADGDMVRSAYTRTSRTTTGARPAPWSVRLLDDAARERLVSNIVGHLLDGLTEAGAAARLRVLAQRGQGPRRQGRGRRPRPAGLSPGEREGAPGWPARLGVPSASRSPIFRNEDRHPAGAPPPSTPPQAPRYPGPGGGAAPWFR